MSKVVKDKEDEQTRVKMLLYNRGLSKLYRTDMTTEMAEKICGRREGSIYPYLTDESLVIYYLERFISKDLPEGFIELYVDGMTLEMAETAVKNDERYPGYRSRVSEQMCSKYNLFKILLESINNIDIKFKFRYHIHNRD